MQCGGVPLADVFCFLGVFVLDQFQFVDQVCQVDVVDTKPVEVGQDEPGVGVCIVAFSVGAHTSDDFFLLASRRVLIDWSEIVRSGFELAEQIGSDGRNSVVDYAVSCAPIFLNAPVIHPV
ncbi:hypothetical protein CJ203_02480 [Corynebacterium tuscaniense]|uniref:Uncharacterized protein n=1 Tax=Corynebacterium tuscaniense TaxID=302449 RepID=A0A2N6T6H7_9CORY|nr:hypothetical protein CJ203_02480 [Corynebacterium tuscaniense]